MSIGSAGTAVAGASTYVSLAAYDDNAFASPISLSGEATITTLSTEIGTLTLTYSERAKTAA